MVDASALKEGEGKRWMERPGTAITPHPGEFARLFRLSRPLLMDERLALVCLRNAVSIFVPHQDVAQMHVSRVHFVD